MRCMMRFGKICSRLSSLAVRNLRRLWSLFSRLLSVTLSDMKFVNVVTAALRGLCAATSVFFMWLALTEADEWRRFVYSLYSLAALLVFVATDKDFLGACWRKSTEEDLIPEITVDHTASANPPSGWFGGSSTTTTFE